MISRIKEAIARIDFLSKSKTIKIISHFDTDGISSAAIFSRAMQKWKKNFSLEIVKGLEEAYIEKLPEDHILIFLDLASGSLPALGKKKTDIFILDHHEITSAIPDNVFMINPQMHDKDKISGAGVCYLFAKTLSLENRSLSYLAVIGMVGDLLERDLSKTYDEILKDSETIIKKGILIYPSTRPLDKALEFSSNPYIPGVSGNYSGCIELLKEANIERINGRYKSLYELSDDEMSKLV